MRELTSFHCKRISCRTCNSLLDFRMATTAGKPPARHSSSPSPSASAVLAVGAAALAVDKSPQECPPDVVELGRSSWTLLHSIAATYPEAPSAEKQQDLLQFVTLFGKLYPCWFCAKDFQAYVSQNKPKVRTQEEFGRWLCDSHNEVNVKLGKPKFDCNLWKERWKDGWKDGSCD